MHNERPRVVIADDSADSVADLSILLGMDGYEAIPAHDGHRAIELVAEHDPHCVMLDVCMPGGGAVLAAALRERFGPSLVLIGMTGLDESDAEVAVVRDLVDYLFMKPIDPATLRAMLPPCQPTVQAEAAS